MSTNPYRPPETTPATSTAIPGPRAATPMQRWVAALVDGLLIVATIFLFSRFIATSGIDSSYIGFFFLIGLLTSYEPIMVSRFRGTLGHKFFGLRVVMDDNQTRVGFFRALVRLLLKGSLGLLSFLWMLGSKQQALHDRLTKTKVLRR